MEENKSKEGVVELPSGLQYKILTNGTGVLHPLVDTPCSCHYQGQLIDGTVFDSSYERGSPTTFAPNQVIKGWTEAMQLMVQGDKWELYIPSELAYGDGGSPPKIPGGSVLVFQMEIIELQGPGKMAMKCNIDTGDKCSDKEIAYAAKVRAWEDKTKGPMELKRLQKIVASSEKSVKPELINWMMNRIYLLEQIFSSTSEQEL